MDCYGNQNMTWNARIFHVQTRDWRRLKATSTDAILARVCTWGNTCVSCHVLISITIHKFDTSFAVNVFEVTRRNFWKIHHTWLTDRYIGGNGISNLWIHMEIKIWYETHLLPHVQTRAWRRLKATSVSFQSALSSCLCVRYKCVSWRVFDFCANLYNRPI